MISINELLEIKKNQILNESGIRIPSGVKNAKILHHDDFDGIMSAVAMALQLKKQGIDRIETGILHDRDTLEDQKRKLVKRKNQMLVVVDFDRFKDPEAADSVIDVQTDHHETERERSDSGSVKGTRSHKSVGKTQYGSDVMHITSTKALNFIDGTDLDIMNRIDSAKFGADVSTNIYLQKRLSDNDGPQRKKMRLAIITSSILGQLVRSAGSVNPGAVQSIIREVADKPSIINFYNQVRKHVDLQKNQVQLLKAFEGKENGEIDWDKIQDYNEKVPREMRIGITKDGKIKKGGETKRREAASEEELSKRNIQNQVMRDLDIDPISGKAILKSKDVGDANLKPWEVEEKFDPIQITPREKTMAWRRAEYKGRKTLKIENPSRDQIKKAAKPFFREEMENLKKEKGAGQTKKPGILRKTENISIQSDMKGNRYLAYEDEKIAANIRDFWKFWQMAMRPDYYQKFINAAKAKGIEFSPEEIDLVDLGKKALEMAKNEMFTTYELEKRGFDNPRKLIEQLNRAYDISYAKSGGHKAITNIDLGPIYGETYNKYKEAERRAQNLIKSGRLTREKVERMKEIEERMSAKSKLFSNFLRQFKERVQTLLSQAVQGRINRTRRTLSQEIKKRGE